MKSNEISHVTFQLMHGTVRLAAQILVPFGHRGSFRRATSVEEETSGDARRETMREIISRLRTETDGVPFNVKSVQYVVS